MKRQPVRPWMFIALGGLILTNMVLILTMPTHSSTVCESRTTVLITPEWLPGALIFFTLIFVALAGQFILLWGRLRP